MRGAGRSFGVYGYVAFQCTYEAFMPGEDEPITAEVVSALLAAAHH